MGSCFSAGSTKAPSTNKPITSNANLADLKATYKIDNKVLGAGSFGKVFVATDKQNSKFKVAVKVISKKFLTKEEIENLKNEVAIMNKVDHPNIVKYYETYDEAKFIYLVMELCDGGELFHKIEKEDHINE